MIRTNVHTTAECIERGRAATDAELRGLLDGSTERALVIPAARRNEAWGLAFVGRLLLEAEQSDALEFVVEWGHYADYRELDEHRFTTRGAAESYVEEHYRARGEAGFALSVRREIA